MDIFLIELSGAKVALKKEMYFQSKNKTRKQPSVIPINQTKRIPG